jgi:hypothetical protein
MEPLISINRLLLNKITTLIQDKMSNSVTSDMLQYNIVNDLRKDFSNEISKIVQNFEPSSFHEISTKTENSNWKEECLFIFKDLLDKIN